MGKVKRVRYITKEKIAMINPDNIKLYDKYLRSSIIKNKEVEATTYNVYKNNMQQFMVYLAEEWDNLGLYDEELMEDAIDIMEGYINFCQTVLGNNKKTINNKLAAVSSFYHWSLKRKAVEKHPFDGQLERMKNAQAESIISSYYLNLEDINLITEGVKGEGFDIQDRLIWGIMLDSCNRVGAMVNLTLDSLDLEELRFKDIREKMGYRVEVTFSEETAEIIKEWLELRKDMDNLTENSFFITKFNGEYRPMTKMTIQNRTKKFGTIIGLEDFRSHCIRKTAVNQIFEQTGDMSLASEMANHKSMDTTKQSYIKPKSKNDTLKEIARKKKEKLLKDAELAKQ